jgi:hypothetical protein
MSAPDFQAARHRAAVSGGVDGQAFRRSVAQDGGFILYPQAGADEEPRFVSAQEISKPWTS